MVTRLFAASVVFLSCMSLMGNAQADVHLLTSIKPLQLIAAAVQDGVGTPDVLLPPGASPHDYALRPSDVRKVRDAQLLYWIGPDMETFLPKVLQARALPSVAVQTLPGLKLRHFAIDNASHIDDATEHDHEHQPGGLDAHLWLSSENARVIAAKMAADLSAADPSNGPRYASNLQAFDTQMDDVDQRIKARVAKVQGKPFFVFHEAFDYFEDNYGLKHAGVFTVSSEVQAGAQHVAAMRQRLTDAGPACVFTEPPIRPRLADTLSAGLPVRLAEMDDLGSPSLAVDKNGYATLMENLANDLVGCLEKL